MSVFYLLMITALAASGGQVRVWELSAGEVRHTLAHGRHAAAVSFAHHAATLAVAVEGHNSITL